MKNLKRKLTVLLAVLSVTLALTSCKKENSDTLLEYQNLDATVTSLDQNFTNRTLRLQIWAGAKYLTENKIKKMEVYKLDESGARVFMKEYSGIAVGDLSAQSLGLVPKFELAHNLYQLQLVLNIADLGKGVGKTEQTNLFIVTTLPNGTTTEHIFSTKANGVVLDK